VKAVSSDAPPRYERKPGPRSFTEFEPRVRALLKDVPNLPATVLAERVGWSGSIRWFSENVKTLRVEQPPGSPHPKPWRTSTSMPRQQHVRRSVRWPPAGSSPRPATSSCSARPAPIKTYLATALGVAAARHGHRVLFATATDWVTRLTDAHRAGRLPQELVKLRRYALIIVDEVGYLPFEQDAANLFFQLVSSRYEHASLVLTSNLPF
jgi:hypothetical protein